MKHTFTIFSLSLMLWLIAVCGTCPKLQAQDKVGTTAAPFLGIAIGPRAVAMGGAFTAMKDDPAMLYWNPAAIARNPGVQLQFTNANWLIGTRIVWAGATVNAGELGTFGAAVNVLTSGDMEVTTDLFDRGTGEFFSVNFASFQLSYGRALTDKFAIGATFKYIIESLYRTSATTIAIDLGILYDINPRLRLASTLSNFGGNMRQSGNGLLLPVSTGTNLNGQNNGIPAELRLDDWNLPLFYRIGVAADVISSNQNRLTLAIEAVNPSDNKSHLNLGSEYGWRNIFFLRAGYSSILKEFAEEGFTCGIGLRAELIGTAIKIDYAYQSFGRLNAPQWLSLGVIF
jgi:hypothetical protein